MGLSLTVLGCSGSYPGPGQAASGYLVQGGGVTVWVDAGSGTLANLQTHVTLDDVDAVVLSHEHPDHWMDFEGFYIARRYAHDRPVQFGCPVYAPAGVRNRVSTDEQAPWFDWHLVSHGDCVDIGELRFTFSRTDHGPETLAMRIERNGTAIGYSADTGPAWSLAELGHLDMAVCEATFQVEQEGLTQHLSARQAGKSARDAGVGKLLLTHVWPTLDLERSRQEGSEAFGAPVDMASIGARYVVG